MNLRNALRSEDTEQIQVVAWADWNAIMHPELKWLHHIPNGGSRNKAEAVKLKQMGVRSGISDLFLPCARGMYHGLYIEMKYGDGRLQQTQKEFLSDMTDAGYYVATCYTAEQAINVIKKYINLGSFDMRDVLDENSMTVMSRPSNSIWKDEKLPCARGMA